MADHSRFSRLTNRQAAIIRILLQAGAQPITIKEVASQLEISSRTVLRELPEIERWFQENDIRFVRKPSVGLSIQESEETLRQLQYLLDGESVLHNQSRQERRRQLLGELLLAKEPVKSYVFLSRFQISEGTLSADLDALGEWLSTYHIRIVRRPGVGILLEGSEDAYRRAIAGAAFEFLDEGEVLHLLRSAKADASSLMPSVKDDRLFYFMEPETVTFLEQILRDIEQRLGIQYTDSGYMALIVHLSLAIHRLQTGEQIEMDIAEQEQLKAMPEYDIAKQIAEKINRQFQLSLPDAEIGFITIHLHSARIWKRRETDYPELPSMNTRQIVAALVQSVERQVGLPFHTCTRLIEDLTSHIDAVISRLAVNAKLDTIQNATQTEMIRQNYPAIYRAVEQAKNLFKSQLMISSFPPSEITFITMHFAAAAELLQAVQRRVTVAVACPSGMGASRMLAANLTRSCPELEVRQVASALRITAEQLQRDGIDLVISTIPVKIDFPVVCVRPIPQAQDMLKIMQAVEKINARRQQTNSRATAPSPKRLNRSKLDSITRLGIEIGELLDNFTICKLSGLPHTEDLIGHAANLFANNMNNRRRISSDLAKRESYQSTFIADLRIYLLHCCTQAITHCRFGYLQLQQPIIRPDGMVDGAMLMLAPESERGEYVAVISHMSMLLAEDKRFLEALKRGDEKEGRRLAEQALLKYYESEIQKKIGVGNL